MTGYGPELAAAHHDGYGDVARAAAAVLRRELRDGANGLVVDLGCGTGILARVMTDAGFEVLGVDLSADMIAIAHEHAPAARFVVSSFVDVDLPPCRAITAIGEIVNYAFDVRSGRDALRSLFKRVHTALAPDGVLLFDVAGPGRAGPTGERFNWRDAGDTFVAARAVQHGMTLTRDITMFTRAGDTWTRSNEVHTLHLYDPQELARGLRASGFDVEHRDTYDGVELGPGMHVFIARKR